SGLDRKRETRRRTCVAGCRPTILGKNGNENGKKSMCKRGLYAKRLDKKVRGQRTLQLFKVKRRRVPFGPISTIIFSPTL
ncbi:hypothetical protein DPEC_G00156340, partial [Dallia pectoralis]